MSERFFTTPDEEYDAASWLSTLKMMQRLGGRLAGQTYAAPRICRVVLHKPDALLDEFSRHASTISDTRTAEQDFLVEIGAASRDGHVVRGLSDAALLLCDDPISQEIRETSSFARLVPLVDQMADYCDTKFLKDVAPSELESASYSVRLCHARAEADFYIRQYDEEPETVVTSPLYL